MFMVPQPELATSKLRLFVDGRPGNPFYVELKVTYKSLWKLSEVLVRNNWTVAFGISDAYHRLAVNECDCNFMAICAHGEFFRFPALPSGWCDLPYSFTDFVHDFNGVLRSGGVLHLLRLRISLFPACAFS